MYIEQGFKGLHEGWRYLVGFILVFIGWQVIGALPLLVVLMAKALDTGDLPVDIAGMSELLGSNLFLFLMLFTFAVALITLFLVVKFLHKQKYVDLTTSRKRVDWKRIWFAFLTWAIISGLLIGLDIILSPDDYVLNFSWTPFLILLLIAVIFIPLQTSFEEFFMRGYLMQGLGILTGRRWVPLIFTSVFFGLLHIFNPEVGKMGMGIMVFYIGTGFFLGILTLMDEGLELALGFHAANNLVAALLVTADWTAFQTHSVYRDISEPEFGWDILIPVLVVFPLLLLLFAKVYGWKDWQEKLFGKVVVPVETNNNTSDDN